MSQRRYKPITPERARALVRAAVVRGDLIRPEACEYCGFIPPRGSDGRSMIQAHHHKGHEDIYNVVWLCVACHAKEDFGQATGEANGGTVHSDAYVSALLKEMADGASVVKLSAREGIGITTLRNWKSGKYRKDLQCSGL